MTDPTPTEVADLRTALVALMGIKGKDADLRRWFHWGLTVERVEALGGLRAHAIEHRSMLARKAALGWSAEEMTGQQIFYTVRAALKDGHPAEAVLRWMPVLVSETGARWPSPVVGLSQMVERWAGFGPLDALAWAAGLTPVEARDLESAGDLDEGGLRTLAALRGYWLPDSSGLMFTGVDE